MAGQEEVGSIVYQVDMEIDPLLQGGRAANRAIGQLDSTASTAGKTFKTLDTQLSSTARSVNAASGSTKRLGGSFQQIGYQIQDFVVQVQGGQSAMVAFGQQGSQLAGAFGPGGAILGAVIALASALAGPLLASLGSSSNKMADLEKAAESLNKIVVINSQGVAALSNDYARLAATNAALATQLRDAAVARYAAEVENARKAVSNIAEEQTSWWRSLSGGVASVTAAGNALDTLSVTTDNFKEAINQAEGAGTAFRSSTQTLLSTVAMMADKFDISEQSAFTLVKQLNELAKTPTSDNVTKISQSIAGMKSTTDEGRLALVNFRDELTKAGASAAQAEQAVKDLEASIGRMKTEAQAANFDSLTKGLNQQLIGLKQGKQAAIEYAIAQQDLTKDQKDEVIALSRQVAVAEAAAEAKKKAEGQSRKLASTSESVAQKLSKLKQQSDLAADATNELSRAQAILTAQQSLGKGATQAQIALAGEYAAKKWDAANAIKAQAAAEKLLPEARENASYAQDVQALNTALSAKKISQEQYNSTSEQLEQNHQVALAQIRAGQSVSPMQEAQGSIDPVQALANEHAKKLALIQQFETQKGVITANGLALMNAANMVYEKARTDAQWALFTQQSVGMEALGAAVDSFGQGASSALSGVITGTQSASDAMRGLADTVLSSVIQTFVEMGLQQAKSALMGAAVQQSAIATTTATQIGALGTTTAASVTSAGTTMAAWLPAALVASVGSFGAAAIIGGAALVGAFALSKTLSGKRKNGGPVQAGSLYQVGEGGMPEVYQASNGSQYMIPGDNGKVISNRDMQSGGGAGGVVINITNTSSGAQVTQQGSARQDNGRMVVDMLVSDINNGGQFSNTMQQTFGLTRRARGDL
uniref:phage tail protein n=1 Tax=Serratia quinivorans TaxID=137545 RepID=UPI0035C6A1B8